MGLSAQVNDKAHRIFLEVLVEVKTPALHIRLNFLGTLRMVKWKGPDPRASLQIDYFAGFPASSWPEGLGPEKAM